MTTVTYVGQPIPLQMLIDRMIPSLDMARWYVLLCAGDPPIKLRNYLHLEGPASPHWMYDQFVNMYRRPPDMVETYMDLCLKAEVGDDE